MFAGSIELVEQQSGHEATPSISTESSSITPESHVSASEYIPIGDDPMIKKHHGSSYRSLRHQTNDLRRAIINEIISGTAAASAKLFVTQQLLGRSIKSCEDASRSLEIAKNNLEHLEEKCNSVTFFSHQYEYRDNHLVKRKMLTQVRKFFAASPEVHLTEFVTSIQLDLFHESAADHSEFPQLAPEEEDRQSKPLTWEQLPIEVLIVLSRYLDVFDKIRLSRVCKRWYDIVQDPAVSQYSIVDPSSCRSWYARKFPKEHSFKTNQIKKKVLGGKYTESDLQHGTTWHKYRSELFYYGGIQLSRRMRSLVIRASEEEFVGNRPVGALLVRVAQLVSDGFLQNLQDISLENCSVALWPLVAVIKSETLRRLRMRNITVIGCGYVVDNLGVLRRTIDSWLVDKLVPVEITGASAVMRSMTFWNLVGEKMRRFDPETKQKLGKCWKKVAQNQPHVAEMISLREQPANTTGVDVTTLDFKTFKTSTFRELDCLDRQIQLPSKCKMFFCCLT